MPDETAGRRYGYGSSNRASAGGANIELGLNLGSAGIAEDRCPLWNAQLNLSAKTKQSSD